MSDPRLMSYLEEMKTQFWHERRHLHQDEIKLQWAAGTAPYTSILFDTEAQTLPSGLTSIQTQPIARQSTSKSWAEGATKRRGSDSVAPVGLGLRYHDAPSSEPMSRKRARTSQYGPGNTATTKISTSSLDTNAWQRDNNAPYCGYTNTSTSGPSFKARRTTAGRVPINIPDPEITIYEPAEYLQQSRALPSSSFSPNTGAQRNLDDEYIPPSSLERPSPFSTSPTTTASERLSNTTPPTSAAMSREDSLATSFCGAFEMMRANSGVSGNDSSQNMCRQDSCYDAYPNSFSPDGQGVSAPFDPSIYFAHAEGIAIEDPSASTLVGGPLQSPTALELDREVKRGASSPFLPTVEQVQPPSSMLLHTEMKRDASSDSNSSSTSRLSRRSQEQVAQAARPIAPKDEAERTTSKQPSSSLSGGQDMRRQRSAPEQKKMIPKLQYSRQAKEKLKCEKCNRNPDGYRGSHELRRHIALDHKSFRIAWVCVDISPDGFLSGCAACDSKKPYGQDYNAAAHLRRFHFHPRSGVRRSKADPNVPKEPRGGFGGGNDPSLKECRRWLREVQVPGKDYMALADSAIDDNGDDAGEDDEEEQEERDEQAEQDEMVRNSSGNVQTDGGKLQSQDAAVDQQIGVSPLEDSDSLDLATINGRHFSCQVGGAPFSRSSLESACETSLGPYFDTNAASFTTPTANLAFSPQAFSSSAPVAPSFLSSTSADSVQIHRNFAHSTPNPLNLPPTSTSNTSPAYALEDFSNFQPSYMIGNVSYGMSSPNNPQIPYELLDFPPFQLS